MYVLDTDILSDILKKSPSPSLLSKLADVPPERIHTTAVNLAELYFGAYRSAHGPRILDVIRGQILPRVQILSFDEAGAEIYGRIRAELEKRGAPRGESDLRIASIALQYRATLVTGNVRHFAGIPGLKVENWLAD